MKTYILDLNNNNIEEEAEDTDGLDEFLDHPSCGLRADGTCSLAGTDYCERLCPDGNVGGPA